MALASLWAEEGKRTEAHEYLAQVVERFTKDQAIADLANAETFLNELS